MNYRQKELYFDWSIHVHPFMFTYRKYYIMNYIFYLTVHTH